MRGLAALLLATTATVAAARELEVGRFSAETKEGGHPAAWSPLRFPKIERSTTYALVRDGDTMVVRADSEASASGLIRRIAIDPGELPVVEWRWKVECVLDKGDVTKKSGDDYPARLYVTFAYDPSRLSFLEKARFEAARLWYGEYPPIAAINYIWESKAPVGSVLPNPYTSRVQMIVVESGAEKAGRWQTERRDLVEDYRRAFGGEPPKIDGVAIMTDTDNTGESATAWYGDIVFRAR